MTCLVRSIGRLAACSLVLALAPTHPAAAANELFGWVFTGPLPGSSRLVTFNLATGARTNVGGTVANCCLVSGDSAIDPAGNRFFFTGNYTTDMAGDPLRLFTISTVTGLVVDDDPLAAGNWNFLEWDPLAAKLFAVVAVGGNEGLYEVNTTTGARTLVGSGIAGCCFVSGGVSALDFDGDRLFFVGRYNADAGTVNRIFTLATGSGALVTDPAPTLPGNRNYNFLEWDPSPGTLYAVVRDTIGAAEELTTINPADGAAPQVGSDIASCCGVSSGVSGLDPIGDRFFFPGVLGAESPRRLWSLALGTGAVVNNPQLSDTENYNFIEFAPSPLPVGLTGFTIE